MVDECPRYMMSLVDTADALKSGRTTSVELTKLILSRIKSHDSHYQSYAQVIAASALESAAIADEEIREEQYRGPLHGIPIAVKDLFHMTGTKTAAGSKILRGQISDANAAVVDKLLNAGAVILGKLCMTEFALSGYHPEENVPVNPWNENFWSGVSSSGSAVATAAGLAYGTVGTDTGGSIRFPACANGVVGIKPTFGSVSGYGSIPLAQTLDHIGPIARRVEDAAIILQAIAGPDKRDHHSIDNNQINYLSSLKDGPQGLKIGVDESYIAADGVHAEVSESVHRVIDILQNSGAEIIKVNISELGAMSHVWVGIVAYEASQNHASTYPSRAEEYGPVFSNLLDAGTQLTNASYEEMREVVQVAKTIMVNELSGVDIIICPASPLPTGTIEALGSEVVLPPEVVAFFMMYAAPFNFTGSPSVTVPCGFDSDNNMPLGVQFVGHHLGEAKLIQAAYAYEQLREWHKYFPPTPVQLRTS
ncbi:MAG: amidase [Pseudomonadales bacterium]|nr:amidase [Pseudomonadales bacterium]